jgi:hypothetical protein
MKLLVLRTFLIISCCMLFTSCFEDPAMVKTNEDQAKEISMLKKQITSLEAQIGDTPEDMSEGLQKEKKLHETHKLEIQALERDIAQSLQTQEKARNEMDAYRKKYPVK